MPNAALAVAPVAMPAWFLAAQKEIGLRLSKRDKQRTAN